MSDEVVLTGVNGQYTIRRIDGSDALGIPRTRWVIYLNGTAIANVGSRYDAVDWAARHEASGGGRL